ncbi:MAG: M56 family metallopeptidase, partial [Acidobacteria bacterium]|nr:M56 family metallopeptidase [Acidobacteriota bacterium]
MPGSEGGACRIAESSDITAPVVIGAVRPLILLPPDWRGWRPSKLRAVLAHESAHIRRRDPLILAMSRWCTCLFWFHPFVWWVRRKQNEWSN